MNIKKIELKNIANFSDTTINLKCCEDENLADIHILVGENGAGKTFIFQYISNHKSTFFRGLFPRTINDVNWIIKKSDWQIEKINQFMNIVLKLSNFNVFYKNSFNLKQHQERLLFWIFDVLYSDIRVLLIDDIESYLDIETQRRILPAIQQVLKGYQLFVSTHSPFVAGSIGNASIYKINPNEREINAIPARLGRSYGYILDTIFDIKDDFDIYTNGLLKEFKKRYMTEKTYTTELENVIKKLHALESEEINSIVSCQIRQFNRINNVDAS